MSLLVYPGDVKRIDDIAVHAPCTGMIIVGGGLVKHHVCNAKLLRNGADYSVFINTGAPGNRKPYYLLVRRF